MTRSRVAARERQIFKVCDPLKVRVGGEQYFPAPDLAIGAVSGSVKRQADHFAVRQTIVRHAGCDVLGPSMSQGRIAYQLGADLRLFDFATGQDQLLPISLDSDFDQNYDARRENAAAFALAAERSPHLVLLLHAPREERIALYEKAGAQVVAIEELEDFPKMAAALSRALFDGKASGGN